MSWSLQLSNGDFALSGASLAQVTNQTKLGQDLRCALLEPMGTDDMHPDYGSLIDGGVTPEGLEVPSLVGHAEVQRAASVLQTEIQRIGRDYQSQQLSRAKDDRLIYGRATLTPGEVLAAITDIQFIQNADALQVTVSVQSGNGLTSILDIPLRLS